MTVQQLPVTADSPRYQFTTSLENTTFTFVFKWNERDGAWYMSLLDGDGVPILTGRRIVINFPLLARVVDARRPAGELIAIDTTNSKTEPGRDDFGKRVLLLYYEAADLQALLA